MNFAKRKRSVVDFLFIIALLAVFLVAALFVILFGTRIYSKTTTDAEVNYEKRTAYYYLTTKLRSFEAAGAVEVSEHDGNAMLVLTEEIAGSPYSTYLYIEDDHLKEITTPEGLEFDYSGGNDILAVDSFNADMVGDNVLKIDLTYPDGEKLSFYQNILIEGEVVTL